MTETLLRNKAEPANIQGLLASRLTALLSILFGLILQDWAGHQQQQGVEMEGY